MVGRVEKIFINHERDDKVLMLVLREHVRSKVPTRVQYANIIGSVETRAPNSTLLQFCAALGQQFMRERQQRLMHDKLSSKPGMRGLPALHVRSDSFHAKPDLHSSDEVQDHSDTSVETYHNIENDVSDIVNRVNLGDFLEEFGRSVHDYPQRC